jgi:hypothetical protein
MALLVEHTIHFDAWDLDADSAAQLSALEQILRPEKVVDQVRAIALSENLIASGLGSDDDKDPDDIAGRCVA